MSRNRNSNRRGFHTRWRLVISMVIAGVFGFSFMAVSPAFAGGVSQTKLVWWMMPGSNPTGVAWSQDGATYGHQLPQCTPTGDKKFQGDTYKYDTSANRAFVDKLLKSPTLNPGDDTPVYVSATFQTPPKCGGNNGGDQQKITLCHAKTPATAKNGWNEITVSVASVFKKEGHDRHGMDIIPAFSYKDKNGDHHYDGKNLNTHFGDSKGEKILKNGCEQPAPELKYVTPMAPTATTPDCTNPNETVTPVNKEGVIWNPSGSTTLKPGDSVTYVATPAAGFKFHKDAQGSWKSTNTFDTKSCVAPVTATVIPHQPTCTVSTPSTTVTTTGTASIGFVESKSGTPTWMKPGEAPAGTYTVELPALELGAQSSWYIVVSATDHEAGLAYFGPFTFNRPTEASCTPPVTHTTPPTPVTHVTPPAVTPVTHKPQTFPVAAGTGGAGVSIWQQPIYWVLAGFILLLGTVFGPIGVRAQRARHSRRH